ncbi:hypothetical protein Mycsm_00318 [Mycobacterium sp. JS623]|nr:hypothetical protein [Mycobacterium sp. JS623]AGB20773.1 hypothetical protein Mycsm_00318 [Mycobacterium sp. JS623]
MSRRVIGSTRPPSGTAFAGPVAMSNEEKLIAAADAAAPAVYFKLTIF